MDRNANCDKRRPIGHARATHGSLLYQSVVPLVASVWLSSVAAIAGLLRAMGHPACYPPARCVRTPARDSPYQGAERAALQWPFKLEP
eukprot:7607652-Alexandrium_andersonii.AAC.1